MTLFPFKNQANTVIDHGHHSSRPKYKIRKSREKQPRKAKMMSREKFYIKPFNAATFFCFKLSQLYSEKTLIT